LESALSAFHRKGNKQQRASAARTSFNDEKNRMAVTSSLLTSRAHAQFPPGSKKAVFFGQIRL